MLAALGVGGPKLLHTLNKVGCLPSYDMARRRVAAPPHVVPNEPSTPLSMQDNIKHVEGVHQWHLMIDRIHVQDSITVSHEARAVGLCATCGTEVVRLCSREG